MHYLRCYKKEEHIDIFYFISNKNNIFIRILIFIHELGHFTVAKLCKVKVNEFAIGFGPAIWKNKENKPNTH